MIKFGFNTLAMLTEGLGIRMAWANAERPRSRTTFEFKDIPTGIEFEGKDMDIKFDEQKVEFEDTEVTFKE